MNTLVYILKFLKYLYRSKGIHRIHSPFVYDLVKDVLNDRKKYEEYILVKKARKDYLSSEKMINVTDLGAGGLTRMNYRASVKSICRKSSKPEKYGTILFRVARYLKPGIMVEFGTSLGLGSLYLALGHKEGKLITVEGSGEIHETAKKTFSDLAIPNIEAIHSDFDDIILRSENIRFENAGLVFLDGNHQKDATIRYFEFFMKLSNNNTVIILDDIHWSKGMEEAWEYIRAKPEVTLTIDLFTMGIVFFRKELSRQNLLIRFI